MSNTGMLNQSALGNTYTPLMDISSNITSNRERSSRKSINKTKYENNNVGISYQSKSSLN